MKKLLFLVSFLFAVVCYAAPPPDVGYMTTDEVAYTADINQVVEISVPGIDVQEVTFAYIGNPELFAGTEEIIAEPAADIQFAELPVIYADLNISERNKPPSNNRMNSAFNTSEKVTFNMNKQNTNYGYPLTAENR